MASCGRLLKRAFRNSVIFPSISLTSNRNGSLQNLGLISLVFSEVAESVILILNFTRPHAITNTNYIVKTMCMPAILFSIMICPQYSNFFASLSGAICLAHTVFKKLLIYCNPVYLKKKLKLITSYVD